MRNAFVKALGELARRDERVVFLTGDLGFMALEPLREQMGERFINAGIAEQNMVTVAAGLAQRGLIPWIYSITPFISLRPFEQLRNDVGLHRLPVRVVGNGGGFGYGIMGATHHALEDVGSFRLLPGFKVGVPVFASDVAEAVAWMNDLSGPAYLRLNLEAKGPAPAPFQPWRRLAEGNEAVVLTMGPVAQGLLDELPAFAKATFDIHAAGVFPMLSLPEPLVQKIEACGKLVVLEEHVGPGGLGENVASLLLGRLTRPIQYLPLSAAGYPSHRYGSQKWHQAENGLTGAPLRERLARFLEGGHDGNAH
jgi:transketolase